MKQQIYQNGFYTLLGLILGAIIMLLIIPSKEIEKPSMLKIEVIGDTTKIKPKISAILNEKSLRKELDKHNIPHKNIVMAQAKLESGNFKSSLTKTHQNIFGLKKGDDYRKYSHWSECVRDYKRYISSRYKGGDYYAFLDKIGYASNPNYTTLLKKIAS